eukprot:403332257
MDKELIAKRLRDANELKKTAAQLHEPNQEKGYLEKEMLQTRFGQEINPKNIIPRSKIDAPSHHDIGHPDHTQHHKPVESILKNLEKKQDEKSYEILSPSYTGKKQL